MPNRFKGEHHIPLLLDGSIKKAEYAGPGTRILRRAEMKIKPLNMVDVISAIHDCEYFLSQTAKTKQEQREMVIKADRDMVKRLNEVFTKKLDKTLNIILTSVSIGIKANLLEKKDETEKELMDLLKKRKYSVIQKLGKYILTNKLDNISGDLENYPEKDIELIKKYRQENINFFNKKVNGMSGMGIGDSIYDIIKKIIRYLFGSKKEEEEEEEKEYEENIRPERKSCEEILSEQDISTLREFRRWSLKNHPDKLQQRGATEEEIKVGTEIYAIVSDCVDKLLSGSGRKRKIGNVKTMNGNYRNSIIN